MYFSLDPAHRIVVALDQGVLLAGDDCSGTYHRTCTCAPDRFCHTGSTREVYGVYHPINTSQLYTIFLWWSDKGRIKWKHFPHYWSFVRGIRQSPVNSKHDGQWRGALMFSLSFVWTNCWVSNRDASYLRRNPAHYDVTSMKNPHLQRRRDHKSVPFQTPTPLNNNLLVIIIQIRNIDAG